MKKKVNIIIVLCVCFIFCLTITAFSEQYEEEFRKMDLEELQSIQTVLAGVINEKRVENAVLVIDPAEVKVAAGKPIKLNVSSDERPITAKTKLTYESSDETIVKVLKGQVTGIGSGTATITVKAEYDDGAILESSCSVAVYIPVTTIKAPQKVTAFVGNETNIGEQITILPENATDKKLRYTVEDNSIISVDGNGVLKGLKGGTTTITIESAQENTTARSAKITVSVDEAVSTIKLNSTNLTVGKGKTGKLEATVGPKSATNQAVEWKSEDPKIATVTPAGVVQGKGTGTTTIICTAKDGSGVTTSATVTVITAVNSIKLDSKAIDMMNGGTSLLNCEVMPKDATNKKVSWSSSNSSIVSVESNGKITAKRVGSCTITAKAMDGSGKTASVTVYVEPNNPVSVNSIHWQTMWGVKNGKMGVYGTSHCIHRKIKQFTCRIEITTWYGNTVTDEIKYSGSAISPGKTGRGKLTSYSVSGFTTASKIKVTVTSVTFSDGTTYNIPYADQESTYFSM